MPVLSALSLIGLPHEGQATVRTVFRGTEVRFLLGFGFSQSAVWQAWQIFASGFNTLPHCLHRGRLSFNPIMIGITIESDTRCAIKQKSAVEAVGSIPIHSEKMTKYRTKPMPNEVHGRLRRSLPIVCAMAENIKMAIIKPISAW